MNAITLLKSDHRKVERLFDRYRSATKGKSGLIGQITSELSMHMDAEERQLYPVLRTALSDGQSLMEESEREHREAKGLLAELQHADAASFDVDAKMATLRRAIDHHVKEEEGEIFPRMERSLPKARIERLGAEIASAKRSAPRRPAPSEARHSPGSSVTGVIAAAADRFSSALRRSDRAAPRKKTSTARTKSARRTRTARRSTRKVSTKTKATARKMKGARRRARRR